MNRDTPLLERSAEKNKQRKSLRKRLLRWTLVVISILILFSISFWQSSNPVALFLKFRIKNWLADEPAVNLTFERNPEDRPVIQAGHPDSPMLVMDPCVISDAEGLHLFYSTVFISTETGLTQFWNPKLGEQFDISKLTTGIAYAFSEDMGLTWMIRKEPLVLPGDEGWDDYRVETANAIVRNDRLHIFYSGDSEQSIGRYQIGEISIALNNMSLHEALFGLKGPLVRQRSVPIISADFEDSCFQNNLQEPSVILRDQKFELYFVGLQMSAPDKSLVAEEQELQRIGMGRALLSDSLDLLEITDEPVIEFGNIIEVRQSEQGLIAFVTLSGEGEAHAGERIAYHTSKDGLQWSKFKTIMEPRAGEFDNWACMSPTAVIHDDLWILFYTALKHDTERNEDYWGIFLEKDSWLFGSLGRAVLKTNPLRRTNASQPR